MSAMLGGAALMGGCVSSTVSDSSAFVVAPITESARYESLHPRFAKAMAFLRRADLAKLPVGRYEIEPDNCWAMVQEAALKPFAGETQHAEVHAAFIDIQAPLDGPETYGLAEIPAPFQPFDAARDVSFGDIKTEPVTLAPGSFAIFMPGSGAHAPCLTTGTPCTRRKLVIKVRK